MVQNLHWKLGQQAPSVGSTFIGIFRDNSLKHFFRNKTFLFFKIESRNFQHLFKKEFLKPHKNFNSIRQIEKIEIGAFYLEKQKSFIAKKYNLGRSFCSNRWHFAVPIFREGFSLKIGKRNWELPEINPNSITNFIGPYCK